MTNLPALHEAVERRRRCGCEKCEGCGSDRDALVNAAPALLDELEAPKDRWRCADCGAEFPRIKHDYLVDRCSSCVERDALRDALAARKARTCDSCTFRWPNISSINGDRDVCGKVSIPGHSVAVVMCDQLGRTCGAWAAKEQA